MANLRAQSKGGFRINIGRILARLFCIIFALIGSIPLAGGLIFRSEPLRDWAANETSRLIREQLGVEATFDAELSLVPLRLAIHDLNVPSNDGGASALTTRLASVSPRFFSLLAGRIDVGDIELQDSSVRLVVKDGAVLNAPFSLQGQSKSQGPELKRSPFRSLSVTNLKLDLQLDQQKLKTEGIDLDAFAEPNLQFDVAIRLKGARATQVVNGRGTGVDIYEDAICGLDLRARLSPQDIFIRRLSLSAEIDASPVPGTQAECTQSRQPGDLSKQHLALRLSSFHILPIAEEIPTLRGSVAVRVPLNLTDRIPNGTRFKGWISYAGEFSFQAGMRLPEMIGQAAGEDVGFGVNESTPKTIFTERFVAELALSNDIIRVPQLKAQYAGGEAIFEDVMIAPFDDKVPMSVEKIVTDDVNFPELMRYLTVTENSWVGWEFGHTEIDKVRGTLSPFYIDGGLDAHTHSFAVYDQSFKSPSKKTMVHVDEPTIRGRFRAHTEALEFYDIDVDFEDSHLPVDLVHLGFESWLKVKISQEAQVNLAAIGPLGALDIGGLAHLTVDLDGPMSDPPLLATLAVKNLSLGGFQAGDVEAKEVHFHPLQLAFNDIKGRHGKLKYRLPNLDINFEGDASVEVNAALISENFHLDEFFEVFELKEDPRFEGLKGSGRVEATINYLLGGVRDPCAGGRLRVSGRATMGELELLEELYAGGRGQFDLDFFDLEAGIRGARLNVPSVILKKGSGSIAGALQLESGGRLSGQFIATRVPISRIDALRTFFATTDGSLTGFGELNGSIERLGFEAHLNISELKAGKTILRPSSVDLKLEPSKSRPASLARRTACNRPIPASTNEAIHSEDAAILIAQGQLFGGEIVLERIAIRQSKEPILSGRARVNRLDLGELSAIIPGLSTLENLPQGRFTGRINVEKSPLNDLMLSQGELYLTEGDVSLRGFRVHLNSDAQAKMAGGVFETKNLSFQATTPNGETGLFDVAFQLRKPQHISASIKLRESSLDILSSALPGVTHAEGRVTAEASFDGPIDSINTRGTFKVFDGKLFLDDFGAPITDLKLLVELNNQGLKVLKGDAEFAGGQLLLTGQAPFSAPGVLGDAELHLTTTALSLPLEDNINLSLQSEVDILIPLGGEQDKRLVSISGAVDVLSASYKKEMGVTADLASFASRGKKSEVEAYDAELDALKLDLLIRSKGELKVINALLQSELFIADPGLRMTGTNQRLGAIGTVEIPKGGRIKLRKNEFEIQRGVVRFVDPLRLAPEVDFTAVTDFRRYDDSGASAEGGGSSSGLPTAGNWRIYLHAYGPPDDLKIDLTSEPALAADDIFLLLTVGLTRAELDQARNSGIGSSVALEALGSLSGAESAVTDAVPIDEFRFGSTWSSRTGRAEPTVTIGKRLSERMRASVTTSLSEANEVRSNLEYKATKNLSIQGSYDNSQSGGSAVGNNIGGDVRWRIEFE